MRLGLLEHQQRPGAQHPLHALDLVEHQPAEVLVVPSPDQQDDVELATHERDVLDPRRARSCSRTRRHSACRRLSVT